MSILRNLKRSGLVGINKRNLAYIIDPGFRPRVSLVDDKILTKSLCRDLSIPVPRDYAVVTKQGQVKDLPEELGHRLGFVVKPARGSGGRGILVVTERDHGRYRLSDRSWIDREDLCFHLLTVLSGLYSRRAETDRAIIEERIVGHRCFDSVTGAGTPDVRVLLYREIPVMAMIRLPTSASGGRANLHQGGVGAGIDLETGETLGGVHRNRRVCSHPDTGRPLRGLVVPCWSDVLRFATTLASAIQLPYLGVDFAIDVLQGPLVLEANARPGLAIQIANTRGLLTRLEAVDRFPSKAPVEDRIRLAQSLARK